MIFRKLMLFFILCSMYLMVAAQSKIEYIYPTTVFDSTTAANLLDGKGKGVIKGIAKLNNKPLGYFAQVLLFPLNDYMREYIELEKTVGTKGKKRAALSPAALSYKLITKITQDGEFEFTSLHPGTYFIECFVTTVKEKRGSNVIGQNTLTWEGGIISGPPITESYTYNKYKRNILSGMITITNEGEAVTATIKD